MHKAKKSLGQNFLKSESALKTITQTADIAPTDHIIEIGPGLGALTSQLAPLAGKLTVIELDRDLIPVLHDKFGDSIEILRQDALDYTPPTTPYKIVANIPYYITSPLLNHFLQAPNKPDSMTLLVQKEVAEKLCLLNPKMSVLSLQVALFGEATYIETVLAEAFDPAPKVDSAIIHIQVAPKADDITALAILKLAKQAFTQGRKKLSNTLADHLPHLEKLNLQDQRPQHLSIEDWLKLSQVS